MEIGFVTMLAFKIATVGGVGIGISSLLKLFHTYEWKPTTKKGGSDHDNEGESFRERAKKLS